MTPVDAFKTKIEGILKCHETDRHRQLVNIDRDLDTRELWIQAVDVFGPVLAGAWFAQEDRNLRYRPVELTDYDAAIPILHGYLDTLGELKQQTEDANRRVSAQSWWPFYEFADTVG